MRQWSSLDKTQASGACNRGFESRPARTLAGSSGSGSTRSSLLLSDTGETVHDSVLKFFGMVTMPYYPEWKPARFFLDSFF